MAAPQGLEISGSWMNLTDSSEVDKTSTLPRKATDILATLQLKLAILSGGRDEGGREIITFPSRPKNLHYDHKQILKTLQYLSTIPSPEASELGFAIIIDGRCLPWSEVKLILRTSQEALPGAIHVAYVLQPSQFVHKQQMSMSLSKEKEKLEFAIVKVSSIDKLLRQLDGRQLISELGGSLTYKHEEWLELRIKIEELSSIYQAFLDASAQLEGYFKNDLTSPPDKLSDLQAQMASLQSLKPRIDASDEDVNQLGVNLKTSIEIQSGSTGMTPERVNCLANVNKILQLTNQQKSLLMELYTEKYHRLDQWHSLKQFDLGITKVNHWIKTKGFEEVSNVDIGNCLSSSLALQDKLTKLKTKVESMRGDVTELKRVADVLAGAEFYDQERVKSKLNKMTAKYSKFTSTYERRVNLITRAVNMYQALERLRGLYKSLTEEAITCTDNDVNNSIVSLDNQHREYKEIAQVILREGQELVKILKESNTSHGDPEFRCSLRYVSRTTDEVSDKVRRSQELFSAKRARYEQCNQYMQCLKDSKESINKLRESLKLLKERKTVIGPTLEVTRIYLSELNEYNDDIELTKKYAEGLLRSALHQRQDLNGDITVHHTLQSELDDAVHQLENHFALMKSQLERAEKLQMVYEGTQATIDQWSRTNMTTLSDGDIDKIISEMDEKGNDILSAVNICLKLSSDLKGSLIAEDACQPLQESIEYIDKLTRSLSEQQVLLTSLLTNYKEKLKKHKHFKTLHSTAETILVWVREEGLINLNQFCSPKFVLSDVQDQLAQFMLFKQTCDMKTDEVNALSVGIDHQTFDDSLAGQVNKRLNDLDNIWKRFLIRVDNRKNVLSSLLQFLDQCNKICMVEGAISDRAQLDRAMEEGKRLVELLERSPGGTQDSHIAQCVTQRMEELSGMNMDRQKTGNASSLKIDIVETTQEMIEGEELPTKTTPPGDEFQRLESSTDDLLQKLLNCINLFLKNHSNFPSTITEADRELLEHKTFLSSLQTSITQLQSMANSLKSYSSTTHSMKNKVFYLVDRVEVRLKERVSIMEKRISALEMFKEVHIMNEQCQRVKASFEALLDAPGDVEVDDIDGLLVEYEAKWNEIKSEADRYSSLSRSFTSLSSELEGSGAEARRIIRSMLRKSDESVTATHGKYQQHKDKLTSILKKSENKEKQAKLLKWLTEVGIPFAMGAQLGTDVTTSSSLLDEAEHFAIKAKSVTDEVKSMLNERKMVCEGEDELRSTLKSFNDSLLERLHNLQLSRDVFKSGTSLLLELSQVIDEHDCYMNPIVADGDYSVLCRKAKRLCGMAQRDVSTQDTVINVSKMLKHVDDKLNQYLVMCQRYKNDTTQVSFSDLDELLNEIEQNVNNEGKQVNVSKAKQSKVHGAFYNVKLQRNGSGGVKELKKMFESPIQQRKENKLSLPPNKESLITPLDVSVPSSNGGRFTPTNSSADISTQNNVTTEPSITSISTTDNTTDSTISTVDNTIPTTDSTISTTDNTIPTTDSTISTTDNTIPTTDSTISTTDNTIPTTDSTISTTGNFLPTTDSTSSSEPPPVPPPPVVPDRPPLPSDSETDSSSTPPIALHQFVSPPSITPPRPPTPPSTTPQFSEPPPRPPTPPSPLPPTPPTTYSPIDNILSDEIPTLLFTQPLEEDESPSCDYHMTGNEYIVPLQDEERDDLREIRVLSPVFEDDLEHNDVGWLPRNKLKSSTTNDISKTQWTLAHKQSLQSMRSILATFYNDEVEYTKTVNKLIEVYYPILQYTQAYSHLHELADFQSHFLDQLTSSLSNISSLCACFQNNIENFRVYFPYMMNYDASLNALSQCSSEELSVLTQNQAKTNEELLIEYTSPYYRLEIYCQLFQQLLQAAYKEDLMSLAALSETLEALLTILRKLSTELACTKIHGCPFVISASEIIAANPFLVHIANREKEVFMYTVFLHPQMIILAERHFDQEKEQTEYYYVMNIPIDGLLLIENYHGFTDRFAICERGQTSLDNMVVFRAFEDISIKEFWVFQLQEILSRQVMELTPQEVLQPEQVDQLGHMIPKTAPPPPGPSQKLDPLRYKKKKKSHRSKDETDTIINQEESYNPSSYTNIHRVVIDHCPPIGSAHNYLTLREGDLVNVVEERELNCLVVTIPMESSDEEEEGFVPSCCLEAIHPSDYMINRNNNNSISPPPLIEDVLPMNDEQQSVVNGNDLPVYVSDEGPAGHLQNDWTDFCARTGHFEEFPNCMTEEELLQAKMQVLINYHLITEGVGVDEMTETHFSSDTSLNELRKHLYKAPFLGNVNEEPSNAQLNGVFSLSYPYKATEPFESSNEYQVTLRVNDLVKVLDSKRDDWWLVSHITEDKIGWVPCQLLQEDTTYISSACDGDNEDESQSSRQLWIVLADYVSENDRTISVARGDIVEVVETSSNQWSLIRTMDMVPREGWIPSEFVELYDYTNHTLNGVRSSSFGARSSSTDGENYDFPQTSPLSPTLSNIGLTDEEEKKEAIEHRDFTLSELIDSEKQYIDRLDFCLSSYKLAIDENNATIPKSLKASSNELFGNIQEIYDFHKREILPQLEGCRDNLSDLADLFALSAQQMKALYVTYCQGKHRSEDVYNEHIEYLEDIREKLRDRLCLRDYLILPVQRITKYNLLLKSINEDSCKAGEAIPYFESALAASKEISVQANNVVHMSMIEGIDRRLNEFGELVLQDSFGVCDRQKALYKERRVFLFTNVLVITKKKIDTAEREMYINKETLMLLEVTFSEDTDVEKRNIIIYDISTGNKFVLKTLHMSVRDEWMAKAQELINIARRATVGPSRTRSVSEPVDYVTSNKQLNPSISHGLLRNGSQRSRRARSRPSSASRERKPPQAGTKYVVMECVVLEGGDDCQLEPKEIVELVRVEASGMLRVRTSDGIEGTIPPGFVRRMDDVSEGAMETAPRITVAPVDQTLFISENFSVSCAFNGLPPPNVVWKRDDVVINPEGGKAKISSCATSSVLEVYNVDYHNEGQYSCTVTNGLGNATAEMDLFIHGPPSKPSKPTVSKQSLTSVKLKWSQPEYNGHSIISSYLVEQLQEGLDDWMVIVQQLKTSFVVKTLNVNTWYQFRIIANNEHGSSNPGPPSDRVFTTKTPKVISATDDRKINENESSEMIASVGGLVKALHPILDVPDVTNIRYDSINSYYNVLPGEVGRGQFGIVKKCTCKHDNSLVAAKFLNHSSEAMREVTILQKLPSSPHIMEFVDAFITDGETLVLVTELLNGGELIDWILIDDSPLTEGLVANYVHQLLLAIEFIHNRNIIHLDIKPENLLITTIPQPTLKLIDFGSAQELDDSADLSIKPDSIEFCALEIVFNDSSNINKFTDMWSVGVIAYVLLSGLSPFYIDNSTTMYHKLANVQLDWSPSPFPYLSSHVQNFISSLLKKNTNDRLSVVMAIQHPWIKDNMTQECTTPIDTTLLKDFQVRRKLQTSAKSIKMTSIFDTPGSPLHDDMNYECPPNFDEGTGRIQAPVGAAITLEWNYSGHPQPVVEWEHNERMLVPSDHVTIINDMRSTRVFIDGVIRPDEGVYSCYISNPHGTDIQYCHLIVFDVPSAPSDVTCVPLGPSLLVSWLPSVNDGNSPLTHYVLQVGQEGHDEWETLRDGLLGAAHVVEGLPTGQSYLFRVASGNAIGLSPFSKPSHPILMSTSDDTCSSESSAVSDVKKMHFSEDFHMEYELGAEIGRGLFSVVYKCTQNVTDRSFAAKFIPLNGNNYEMASREFELLKELKHTRIAMMEEAFTTPTHMILILELVTCGELSGFVSPSDPLNENLAARFIRQISEALDYLHNNNIILVNLSPENLTLEAGYRDIKLIDLSLARRLAPNNQFDCNLPKNISYMAPEVFHLQSLTFGADMWSLGGVALFMLSGHHPFNGFTSHNEQIHDIQTMNINVACETCISHLSADCHNLIFDCLLISNPRWVYGETSTTTRRLRHMNTQQQMAYFMEKYPAHFTNESSHDDDEQTLV